MCHGILLIHVFDIDGLFSELSAIKYSLAWHARVSNLSLTSLFIGDVCKENRVYTRIHIIKMLLERSEILGYG